MTSILSSLRGIATKRRVAVALVGAAALAVLVPTVSAQQQAAPANTAEPTISGSPAVGQTLTATNGTWDNSPTTFAYQWLRCPPSGGAPDGSDCAAPALATNASYVVVAGDVGFRLRIRVTAGNVDGTNAAVSNATQAVTAQAAGPTNTAPPTIKGSTVVGEALTADPGTWSPAGATFAYLWSRCDAAGASCVDITTATQSAYTLVTADSGKTLRVKVTGTNASGSNAVTSAQTGVVTSGSAPPTTGCPTGTGPIDVKDITPPARLSIDKQQITPSPVTKSTQTIRIRLHVSACNGRPVEGALVYATPTPYQQFAATEQPTGADGWAVLTMKRLRFFPASNQQQLLVVFARARKDGEDLLAGISTRRLISFKVNLRG